jgi:hypothetical protein
MSDSLTTIKLDRSRCALCGEPNDCALARDGAKSDEPCWCVAESFPAELLEAATAEDGGESCVCRRCLEKGRDKVRPA